VLNEKETLDSTLQLASDKAALGARLGTLKKSVEAVGAAELAALQVHMEGAAKKLGAAPVKLVPSAAEQKAAKIIPRPTAKVTADGYQGYRKYIDQIPPDERAKFPFAAEVSSPAELQLLVNGKHSVLDIKTLLDAQSQRKSTIEGILNYLQILKMAGLVEY
jgi:hypothetical protein